MSTEIVSGVFIPGTPDKSSLSGWVTNQKSVAAARAVAEKWAAQNPSDRVVSVHSERRGGIRGTAVERHAITGE